MTEKISPAVKKEISRLRSEIRKAHAEIEESKKLRKSLTPFTGIVSGNYWTQTGMPWASGEGRKAVMTEYFWQPIRGQPRRVDTNELRQFSQDFWVSTCVKTIMDEIASLEWDIVPKDDYEYEWVADSISTVKSFLQRPNKNGESFTALIRALIKDILEIDAGVIVKVFDINSYDFNELEPKSGAPLLKPMGQRKMTELYVRDGASFLKEMDKFGFVKGFWQYSYQIPAHPMWFNKEEIVYCSEHPRSMSPYGYARTQSILDVIKSLHYSVLYNKKFFEETAIPDGALSLLDTNEQEMTDFRNFWNNEFKAQPHKVAIMNKDMKWVPFSVSNKELEFLDTQKWYFNMVISAFGLTPAELGITEDLNRSTSATQAELVKRKGIRPFLKLLEEFINTGIIPEFGLDGIEFQYIYDDPAEKKQRLDNSQTELNMGIKTVNEVRNEYGLEPIEGGDQSNNLMSRMGQNMMPFPSKVGAEPSGGEDNQSSGYSDTLRREEGDLKRNIQRPYDDNNQPFGNFKSIEKSDKPVEGPGGKKGVWRTSHGKKIFITEGGQMLDSEGKELESSESKPSEKPESKPQEKPEKKPEEEYEDLKPEEREVFKRFERVEKGKGSHQELKDAKELELILTKGHFALISAGKNPNRDEDKNRSEEYFKHRSEALQKDLIERGYMFTRVVGKYGEIEDSYLVMTHNPDEKDMLELGKKYNQDSVIIAKRGDNKMIYTSGEHAGTYVGGHGYDKIEPSATDFYTEVKIASGVERFSLNFEWDKYQPYEGYSKSLRLSDLIAEYRRLIDTLESGDPEKLRREAEEQKRELAEYESKSATENFGKPFAGYANFDDCVQHNKNKNDPKAYCATIMRQVEGTEKGIHDGQYYYDQHITQPIRPSGAHFQPQNPQGRMPNVKPLDTALPSSWTEPPGNNTPIDTNPSQLGSSMSQPMMGTAPKFSSEDGKIKCPICGQNTLAYLNSLEQLPEDVRCTSCSARFRTSDIENAPLMEEMSNVIQQNNMTKPIGKSFTKELDIDLSVKDYVGFDVSKSFPHAMEYADSREYKKKLKGYLDDLPAAKVDKIVSILKNALSTGEHMRSVAKKIESIIGDATRAENIARTEIVRVSNEGNLDHMEEKGTRKAEFLSAPEDGRLCEKCARLNGKKFTIKEARGMIPIHPKCRCSFLEA
jgi:SPP1 gp7 family putative phage head morphogenesis protein